MEQLGYRHHRQPLPNYVAQSQQLTEARAVYEWLRAGSQTVQQQALRDFAQAMANWRAGSHRRPTWRKQGRHEGFRIVGPQALRVEQVNRRWSQVLVPKVERVNPVFTSQCWSVCGHVAAESRQSHALFRCVACGYTNNADVNAARNIAAGRAVTARRGPALAGPVNREPQHETSSVA